MHGSREGLHGSMEGLHGSREGLRGSREGLHGFRKSFMVLKELLWLQNMRNLHISKLNLL